MGKFSSMLDNYIVNIVTDIECDLDDSLIRDLILIKVGLKQPDEDFEVDETLLHLIDVDLYEVHEYYFKDSDTFGDYSNILELDIEKVAGIACSKYGVNNSRMIMLDNNGEVITGVPILLSEEPLKYESLIVPINSVMLYTCYRRVESVENSLAIKVSENCNYLNSNLLVDYKNVIKYIQREHKKYIEDQEQRLKDLEEERIKDKVRAEESKKELQKLREYEEARDKKFFNRVIKFFIQLLI